jgi:hypothetical protein
MTKGLTTQQQVRRLFNKNRPEQEVTINEHFSNDTVGVPRLGPAGLANSSERVAPQMGCQLSLVWLRMICTLIRGVDALRND